MIFANLLNKLLLELYIRWTWDNSVQACEENSIKCSDYFLLKESLWVAYHHPLLLATVYLLLKYFYKMCLDRNNTNSLLAM